MATGHRDILDDAVREASVWDNDDIVLERPYARAAPADILDVTGDLAVLDFDKIAHANRLVADDVHTGEDVGQRALEC